MSWIDKKLAWLLPGYALKRRIAVDRLNRLDKLKPQKRNFDAVSGNRTRFDFLSTVKSADSFIKGGSKSIREQVRQLEYDNGFVTGPIQRIVKNVVGQGIRFQSRVRGDEGFVAFPKIADKEAETFNVQMERSMKQWIKKSDSRLLLNFYEQQAQIVGSWLRDGEVLIISRTSKRKDRLIPYCLEVLEADRLQTPYEAINEPNLRNGILFDDEGAPKAYYVLKRHPGESITGFKMNDYEEIPAFNDNGTRKVLHLFNPIRPEQTRGYSMFASALKDLQDLDRYREAELYAALEDACMTGFVKTANPVGFQAEYTEPSGNSDEYDRIHEFAPGKWHYLKPGEEVDIHSPKRPNQAFGEMVDQILRGPANALDIPPEILTQDWKGMNYSNARTVLLMFYLSCRVIQRYLITHFCEPVYENVARQLIAMGKVQARGFDRRVDDFLNHVWIAPGWSWIDPVKESKGKEIELNNNMETLTDIAASRGKDIDESLETRARELKKMKDLEEKYEIQFPKNQGGKSTPDEDEEDEEGNLKVVK